MDMELKRVALEGYRCVAHTMFSQEETLESIVPDACPDIARIVSASGKAFLKDKELGEGTLRLNGTAKVTVLYIPEGEELPRPLEVTIPFQCVRDDPQFHAGCPVLADLQAPAADARTINPRKMLVRVGLSVWAAAYERERRELSADLTGGEGEGLQKQVAPRKCCVIPEVSEKTFTFSDVLRPPASRPEIEELICDAFRTFVRRNLARYPADAEVSALGGVAFRFERQLRRVLEAEGRRVGCIAESPDEGLSNYHIWKK